MMRSQRSDTEGVKVIKDDKKWELMSQSSKIKELRITYKNNNKYEKYFSCIYKMNKIHHDRTNSKLKYKIDGLGRLCS